MPEPSRAFSGTPERTRYSIPSGGGTSGGARARCKEFRPLSSTSFKFSPCCLSSSRMGVFTQPIAGFKHLGGPIEAPASRSVRVFSKSPQEAAIQSGDTQHLAPSSPRPFGFAPAAINRWMISPLSGRLAAEFRGWPKIPLRSFASAPFANSRLISLTSPASAAFSRGTAPILAVAARYVESRAGAAGKQEQKREKDRVPQHRNQILTRGYPCRQARSFTHGRPITHIPFPHGRGRPTKSVELSRPDCSRPSEIQHPQLG